MKHKTFFNQHHHIYFIGIGGIGISALAKLAMTNGVKVSGTDLVRSEITDDLKRQGAKIEIKNSMSCRPCHADMAWHGMAKLKIQNYDLIIYSTAVPLDNPILTQARKLKIPTKSYPQSLGQISKSYYTVAVSGMHGKSTTTAMIGLMLESAGLDPLVIVGTKVKEWGGNIRINQKSKIKNQNVIQNSKYKKKRNIFVVEADEYKSAMLNLSPNIIVLTRIEEDHLDYYKNIDHIKREFRKYLKKLHVDGCAVVNWRDANIKNIKYQISNIKYIKYNTIADVLIIKKIKKILKAPGKHNLENGLAAYKLGKELGLTEKQILKGLAKFKGTWRRMELVGKCQMSTLQACRVKCQIKSKCQIPIISDYAHHPTEIKATLQALREKYPKRRILLAYQPHQRNRTKMLFNDFINAFDQADVLILNEIFDVAGREVEFDQNISSKDIVREIEKKLKNCYYSPNLAQTKKRILQLAEPNDLIVIMGAGDIDKVARELAAG